MELFKKKAEQTQKLQTRKLFTITVGPVGPGLSIEHKFWVFEHCDNIEARAQGIHFTCNGKEHHFAGIYLAIEE